MGATPAKPVFAAMSYTDPQTGKLTQGAQQALAQWHSAINSIPVSVTGEQAQGAGKAWKLAKMPTANVAVIGVGASGPVTLTPGKGNAWNYSIDGNSIATEQAFHGVIASYEYSQA